MAKRPAQLEQFRPRDRSYNARQVGGRPVRRRILIVCGGATEEWYFNQFRPLVRPHKIEIRSDGVDPMRLVEWAKKVKAQEEKDDAEIDEVWCVFDRDDFGPRYDEAHKEAARADFFVAGSDPCFELWFMLHRRDVQQSLTTAQCQNEWTALLGKPYSKTDSSLFSKLDPDRDKASTRAAKLLLRHEKASGDAAAVPPNPSTTVHKLIAALQPDAS